MIVPILVTCECGKQFQAKDENIGRRFNCPDCGREVTVPKPEADPYDERPFAQGFEVKTSGKAITSLVLGILSMVGCFFFTGLPAVIFGAVGLSNIGSSKGRLGGKGLAIAGIITGGIGSLLMVPILIALLLPAVQAAREAARRAQCSNNLKQIALGMMNFADANDHFPASAILDKEGKPLLSWRVAILPYINQKPLYDQFKLDEPWDSPSNIELLSQIPATYLCPSDPSTGTSRTGYQVIVGPGTMFDGPEGTPIRAITDGTSNTIAVVEAANPVDWTKPDDVAVAQLPSAIRSMHPGGANILMADGSVRFLRMNTPAQIVNALATRAAGEVIASDSY